MGLGEKQAEEERSKTSIHAWVWVEHMRNAHENPVSISIAQLLKSATWEEDGAPPLQAACGRTWLLRASAGWPVCQVLDLMRDCDWSSEGLRLWTKDPDFGCVPVRVSGCNWLLRRELSYCRLKQGTFFWPLWNCQRPRGQLQCWGLSGPLTYPLCPFCGIVLPFGITLNNCFGSNPGDRWLQHRDQRILCHRNSGDSRTP